MTGQVCIDFHNIHVSTDVEVSILDSANKSVIVSVHQTTDTNICIDVPAPDNCAMNKQELVVRISNFFYKYNSEDEETVIKCASRGSITFIQPDKPIYKPGQLVRIRILTVTIPNLTPVVEDIALIAVETPGGTRVIQKKDVPTSIGLAEIEFLLDDFPPLGEWEIIVQTSAGTNKKTIKVDKFVLPKWDVTIEASALVLETQTTPFKVCAFYTFGEAVQGTYNIEVSTTFFSLENVIDTATFSGTMDSSGCVTVTVGAEDLDGFISGRYVSASASVTETVSGIERTAISDRVRIVRGDVQLTFHSRMSSYFKKGSRIYAHLHAESPMGPVAGAMLELKLEARIGSEYTTIYSIMGSVTDDEGDLEFEIPTTRIGYNITNARIKASIKDYVRSVHLKAWYSPTDMYVTIVPPFEDTIPCNKNYNFPIYHNAQPGMTLHYIMISKGYVVLSDSVTIPWGVPGHFHLTVMITPTMAGLTTMVVYYVTQDLEFVSDFISFDVEECFRNQVDFAFNTDKGEPGDEVKYTLSAATDSLCGIGVIDRSLEILAGNSFIVKGQVFEVLKKLNLPVTFDQFNTNVYCRDKLGDEEIEKEVEEEEEEPPVEPPIFDGGGCGEQTFYFSPYVDSSLALNNLGVRVMSDLELQTRPCEKQTFFYCKEVAVPDQEDDEEKGGETSEVDIRKFFPETFLWMLHYIPKSGSVTKPVTLPDTITEWYGNAICTNEHVGLGISDFASIITFQTFFIQLGLPYSIIRGETVHIPVLVFNFMEKGECFAIKISLSAQDTFDIIGDDSWTICSCGKQSKSVEFAISPKILGLIEITVIVVTVDEPGVCEEQLSSLSVSDGVSRTLIVKPEGVEQTYTIGRFLCANVSLTMNLTLPDAFVAGSERARVSVVGDVMGPALSDLGGLIQQPMGCGEQTIYLMAQAAIVFLYMNTIGSVTPEIEAKALSSMTSGYMRELTFKHANGAYSVWGPNGWGGSEGSNWLTAFVIRSFALSDEFIFIDPNEQSSSIAFIKSGQDENGCFPQVGTVIHTEMIGGIAGSNTPIALTALILVSMMEAGEDVNSASVVSGMGCLGSAVPATMSTYALAVSAYAYTLYGQDAATLQLIMDELDSRAIKKDGEEHWSQAVVAPVNPYRRPPSFDVEMTSYVLLAVVAKGDISAGLPIVRWLTSQRNAFGGWSSTQDTFVGLLALSKYAMLIVGDDLDLDVTITPPGVTFHVDSSNMQVLQTTPVAVPNTISISVTGTGCTIVQADVWYNIIPVIPEEPFFDIDIEVHPTEKCERQTVAICTTYLHADGPTNMALVRVRMVTGWSVDEGSLPMPLGAGIAIPEIDGVRPGAITKVEVENDMVTVYFDQLSSEKSCFKFQQVQDVKVDNVKPGFVTVFDYYEPDKTTSASYSLVCN